MFNVKVFEYHNAKGEVTTVNDTENSMMAFFMLSNETVQRGDILEQAGIRWRVEEKEFLIGSGAIKYVLREIPKYDRFRRLKADVTGLSRYIEENEDASFNLWTWLPSYFFAQKHHGDYASEFKPGPDWVMKEACAVLSKMRGYALTDEDRHFFKCPCEDHYYEDSPSLEECMAWIQERSP